MSANGQYYDPKLTQPAPSYYQGAPHGGQPLAQPYYSMSQPQMQAAPQPQIFVNVNQSQKQKGGSGCCACLAGFCAGLCCCCCCCLWPGVEHLVRYLWIMISGALVYISSSSIFSPL
ncbi:hypothetical protein DFH09DRAFT_436481 [Mycena vulgaris]|nr:hypothetical protein DFH09DRAFT_436481 [Mycena vulgaris]